ncbi:MAG: RDD family protein, partial [Chitinophagaceae bacterium]|nr:RDD family protein [Chitinophagaceae bacterium]
MGAIKVPTNFNIELEFEIPEFYRRMLALIIDITIEFFYLKIAFGILNNAYGSDIFLDSESQYDKQAWSMILFVPIMIYHVTLEILMNGQSVGKKIMSLRVVDELGGKPSISQFIIRWLLRVSDVWLLIILILFIQLFQSADPVTIFIFILAFGFLI